MRLLITAALAAILMTISAKTQASSVDPKSFTGKFTVGDCSLSIEEQAGIILEDGLLKLFFEGSRSSSVEIVTEYTEEDYAVIMVKSEPHTLINEYFVKVNDGMLLPVQQIKIARSATGNRVRITSLTYETNMKNECVLYRN